MKYNNEIIGEYDIKHIMMLLIKTIMSVLNVSTYIITSRPIRLTAILLHTLQNYRYSICISYSY